MRVTYPVTYERRYMLRNGGKPVTRYVTETDEIDIPEVTSNDAPVAASWIEGFRGDATARLVRLYGGILYTVDDRFDSDDGEPPTINGVINQLCGGSTKGKLPAERDIAHVLGDNREEAFTYRREQLEDILLVDGTPYMRCHVPKLRVTHHDHADIEVYCETGRTAARTHPDTAFSALVDFDRIAAELRTNGDVSLYVHDLSVLIPEAVEYDRTADLIVSTIGKALDDNAKQLHTWPREAADEFLDIRDALRRWTADHGSESAVDLLDRVYALFTRGNHYNATTVADFFACYDMVQTMIPDMDISIDHVPALRP